MLQFKLQYIFWDSPLFTHIYNIYILAGRYITIVSAKALMLKDRFAPAVKDSAIIEITERLFDAHSVFGMYIMQVWRVFYPLVDGEEFEKIYYLCDKWIGAYGKIDQREIEFSVYHKLSFINSRKVKSVVSAYVKDITLDGN